MLQVKILLLQKNQLRLLNLLQMMKYFLKSLQKLLKRKVILMNLLKESKPLMVTIDLKTLI